MNLPDSGSNLMKEPSNKIVDEIADWRKET